MENPFRRPSSAQARRRLRQLSGIRESCESAVALVGGLDGSKSLSEGDPTKVTAPAASAPPVPPRRRAGSTISLPLERVPERRSSRQQLNGSFMSSRARSFATSLQDFPSWELPAPTAGGLAIPTRGRSISPVRQGVNDSVHSDDVRTPTRTFIRPTKRADILEVPSARHPRIDLALRIPSPLFVGGGTIEGQIRLVVDGGSQSDPSTNTKPRISLCGLSIDVIGVEEVSDRWWVFLSLASELFDDANPPPASVLAAQKTHSPELEEGQVLWPLKPCKVQLPFCLNLPLNLGPAPYLSKQARIRYLICPTVTIKVGEKRHQIRETYNIQMLTVHDPEKALASLPSPLLARDSMHFASGAKVHSVKLTAGLHRQTWVNNSSIFVDVHIANKSPKTIKRLEVQLHKVVLFYNYAAAGTFEKSASVLRLPTRNETEIVCRNILKRNRNWTGVQPDSNEIRTCILEVPRGHVTINTGRFFEVRYFLTVSVAISMFKSIQVQLPITIIHINSLDIVPNYLHQVAASIEAKRASTVPMDPRAVPIPSYHQGLAFTAPRRQSLEEARRQERLTALQSSTGPRKPSIDHTRRAEAAVHSSRQSQQDNRECVGEHQKAQQNSEIERLQREVDASPRRALIPRLQLSTSGLAFSDDQFGIEISPPKKVMLSEEERKRIRQERELRVARQNNLKENVVGNYYNNVAVTPLRHASVDVRKRPDHESRTATGTFRRPGADIRERGPRRRSNETWDRGYRRPNTSTGGGSRRPSAEMYARRSPEAWFRPSKKQMGPRPGKVSVEGWYAR